MRKILLIFIISTILIISCNNETEHIKMEVNNDFVNVDHDSVHITKEVLYDKIFGSLVGSAIGDAMGLPTEMWSTYNRNVEYGYIDSLYHSELPPSPEGAWDFNLPPGSTSDDTRWKLLVGEFIAENADLFYTEDGPGPFSFANFLVEEYEQEMKRFKETDGFNQSELNLNLRRVWFLEEWALVAKPFAENDLEKYTAALHRFYGGDIVCAGMLYSPIFGLLYPGNPEKAYNAGFRLGIFDQGYARDITALTSALVGAAMLPDTSPDDIFNVFKDIDPNNYFNSRIFGRQAYFAYKDALYISHEAKSVTLDDDIELKIPLRNRNQLYALQEQKAFDLLDSSQMHISPHSKEILLISLTAMIFTDFDFRKSIEFCVNYGRDNDTHAAVVGAIIGAFVGFEKLPSDIKNKVLNVNKEKLGIDLKSLAERIAEAVYELNPDIVRIPLKNN